MNYSIKIDLEQIINSPNPVVIELGCGKKKREGRITVDQIDLPNVDIVADIENGLPFLPDNSVDEIHCRSVLEHIENFENLMREITRVLKKTAKPTFLYLISPTHITILTIHIKDFLVYILFIISLTKNTS